MKNINLTKIFYSEEELKVLTEEELMKCDEIQLGKYIRSAALFTNLGSVQKLLLKVAKAQYEISVLSYYGGTFVNLLMHNTMNSENFIDSLCASNPELALELFSHCVMQNKLTASLLTSFLKHINMASLCEKKERYVVMEADDCWGNRLPELDMYLTSNVWPIMCILLKHPPDIIKIAMQYSNIKLLALALKSLTNYYTLHQRYHREYYVIGPGASEINQAIGPILAQLKYLEKYQKPIFDQSRTYLEKALSFDSRRNIEFFLSNQIANLTTKAQVHAFYAKHGDTLYLSHHRYAGWDRVRGVLFPKIKTRLLTQLQTKMASMTDVVPQTEEVEISKLAQLKEALKKLLVIKYNALSHLKVGFFNSARLTQEKKEEISQVFGKLTSINRVDEFRFFTASLMTNVKLVGSRGLGVGLSDTALKLKNFYDEQFLSTEAAPIHKTAAIPRL